MAKKKVSKKKISKKPSKATLTMAIIALLLNTLILPGLGSLIAKKTKEGILQIILAAVGIVFSYFIVGIPILILVWVLGLITGIRLIIEAKENR